MTNQNCTAGRIGTDGKFQRCTCIPCQIFRNELRYGPDWQSRVTLQDPQASR